MRRSSARCAAAIIGVLFELSSDPSVADEIWGCPTEPAYDLARAVARTEGLLVGHSSGAALWAARRLAETIESGVIVTVFPDSGDRYISTGLYGVKP